MSARQIRVLLVGRQTHELGERLRAVSPRVELIPVDEAVEGEAHVGEVDVAIASHRITPRYLSSSRLRWLHLTGAGVDRQAIPELRHASFAITHKAMASVAPMADHVMAQILVFARRVLELRTLQLERRWAEHGSPAEDVIDLRGKQLAVVGLGAVGLAVARRAAPFGLRVVGTKRAHAARLPHVGAIYPPEKLREMLNHADFVVVATPLTDETLHLIGETELRAMKPSAYLINVSRGAVVDENTLVRALREGWIAGASLDVFEHEPLPPESPLWTLPHAIVTPHCSGGGPAQRHDAAEEIARNLRRFVRGQPLLYRLNPADIRAE